MVYYNEKCFACQPSLTCANTSFIGGPFAYNLIFNGTGVTESYDNYGNVASSSPSTFSPGAVSACDALQACADDTIRLGYVSLLFGAILLLLCALFASAN